VAVCDAVEDHDSYGRVIIQVAGASWQAWPGDIAVTLVSKWERALRRIERLPATTIAVASGDCGGVALDAHARHRLPDRGSAVRLLVSAAGVVTWPGLALYRLVRQAGVAASAVRSCLASDQCRRGGQSPPHRRGDRRHGNRA